MTKVGFVGEPDLLAASFRDLCNWAEEIVICTTRFDCDDDRAPFRILLMEENLAKIRHFIVTKRDGTPTILKPFHERGILRFVVERRSRFRPNIYRFRKADEVRVLVGTARLTPESFRSDLEAMMLVEGSWHDEFACQLSTFMSRCLKNARVSHTGDFQEEDPDAFLAIEDKDLRARIVWEQLLGLGPLEKDLSIREAARSLRDEGMIDFKRLDSAGPLYAIISEAIARGTRIGLFDRPARRIIRAILGNAADFPDWLWNLCLLEALDDQERDRGEAIRLAAEWAALNVGLNYRQIRTGGRIESALKRTISRCIRGGLIERSGPNLLRRIPAPIRTGGARDR